VNEQIGENVMLKSSAALAAAFCVFATGAAQATNQSAGFYSSTGTVSSANSACASLGLVAGNANNSVFYYPGAGKSGFTLYVPAGGGVLQLCNAFPTVPSTGLNGWSPTPTCQIFTLGGNLPAEPVNFTFASTTLDKNSGLGQTTISIPDSDPVAPGCQATVTTTTVGSGK
jgi:hypothetical protein